jgi:predicted nucleotide-binding protein
MRPSYPTNPKEQYDFLVAQAEKYLSRSKKPAESTARHWKRRAINWLKEHTPNSELPDSLLGVPHNSIQRSLAILLRARPIVPFLREEQSAAVRPPDPKNAKRVFIVHGHDDALKNAVSRIVDRLGLEPIILHEQPNKGRTIIEKFLAYSDVGFAIVLLTPDDVGAKTGTSTDLFQPRARQNVILELGFFLGRLGRERVAALYDPSVEMPSDYSGVLFVPYDDQGIWALHLSKEMKAAGLPVDLNKL